MSTNRLKGNGDQFNRANFYIMYLLYVFIHIKVGVYIKLAFGRTAKKKYLLR